MDGYTISGLEGLKRNKKCSKALSPAPGTHSNCSINISCIPLCLECANIQNAQEGIITREGHVNFLASVSLQMFFNKSDNMYVYSQPAFFL